MLYVALAMVLCLLVCVAVSLYVAYPGRGLPLPARLVGRRPGRARRTAAPPHPATPHEAGA